MSRPVPPRAAREAQLEGMFRTLVRSRLAGLTYKIAPTTAGLPDRLVLLPGARTYLVELKTETGRLSEIQALLHQTIRERTGHEVVVLRGAAEIRSWVSARILDYDKPTASSRAPMDRARCGECGSLGIAVRSNGTFRVHYVDGDKCPGSGAAAN